MKRPSVAVLIFFVLVIVILAVAGFFGYKYYQTNKQLNLLKSDPNLTQQASQAEVQNLVAEVGKLIDLPQGENPTVATVTDVSKLKDQPFFQNAQNGDKVLIYTKAKKAILYDPNAGKIVDVAPVNIGATDSAQQSQTAKVIIWNGTTSVGLTNRVEPKVKAAGSNFDVVDKDNAAGHNYQKTLIIPLNDTGTALAPSLAKSLDASVSALPSSEKKPSGADILIIAGKDQI